jgi:hypothetical protein
MVQRGIGHAASHGITVEKDVCLFIDVMCALGEEFDADPDFAGVAKILGKDSPKSTSEKVEQLCKVASERLSQSRDDAVDDAIQLEASTALAEAPPRAEARFGSKTSVGQPIVACPKKPIKRRVYHFSV